MLDAALAYAALGVPVLPVHSPAPDGSCSCGRRDCPRPGKHPRLRHGLTDASTDPAVLRRWWQRWPDANVGLRTGVRMDVADLDTATARAALRRLAGGTLPDGPRVRTGGGWHLWFAPTGLGNRVGVLPGLDWRGAGGYVLAPPSRHVTGAAYRWAGGSGPPPPCPPALRRLLAPPPAPPPPGPVAHPGRYAAAALHAAADRVARAPVGRRNDTLNRAAYALGRLVGAGLLDPGTAAAELTAAARRAGLGRAETARTVRSGLTAGRRAPAPPGRAA